MSSLFERACLSDELCSFGQLERCSSECRNVAQSDQRHSFANKCKQRPAVNRRTHVGGDIKQSTKCLHCHVTDGVREGSKSCIRSQKVFSTFCNSLVVRRYKRFGFEPGSQPRHRANWRVGLVQAFCAIALPAREKACVQ